LTVAISLRVPKSESWPSDSLYNLNPGADHEKRGLGCTSTNHLVKDAVGTSAIEYYRIFIAGPEWDSICGQKVLQSGIVVACCTTAQKL